MNARTLPHIITVDATGDYLPSTHASFHFIVSNGRPVSRRSSSLVESCRSTTQTNSLARLNAERNHRGKRSSVALNEEQDDRQPAERLTWRQRNAGEHRSLFTASLQLIVLLLLKLARTHRDVIGNLGW